MKISFKLIVVRHGQAYQNLPYFEKLESHFRFDGSKKILDSDLTEKGQMQANLVGRRLKDTKIDVAITSDLQRAVQTAEAIIKENDSVNELTFCKLLRERYMGDLEGNRGLCHPFWKIDYKNHHHRDDQTSGPLNGESVANVCQRARDFLKDTLRKVAELPVDSPAILVVTHGQFMFELYSIISNSGYGQALDRNNPWHQNTGITEYSFICTVGGDNQVIIEKVECPTHSCANHLDKFDEEFVSCWGGCHATESTLDSGYGSLEDQSKSNRSKL